MAGSNVAVNAAEAYDFMTQIKSFFDSWKSYAVADFINRSSKIVTVGTTDSDYSTLSAALAAITDASSSNRYTILVYGYITESATVTLKSYIHIVGFDARIDVTPDGNGALDANNITNCIVENLEVHSTGAGGSPDSPLNYRGTTDGTVVFINCNFYLDAATSTDAVIWGENSATVKLINCNGYGHAGNVGGVRGIYTGDSAGIYVLGGEYKAGTGSGTNKIGVNLDGVGKAWLIDADFYASSSGTDIHSAGGYISTNGDTDGNQSNPIYIIKCNFTGAGTGLKLGRRSVVYGQGGIMKAGSLAGAYGMVVEDNASGSWIGGEIFGGTNTTTPGYGLDPAGAAAFDFKGTIIHNPEFATGGHALYVYGNGACTLDSVTIAPNKHSYIWAYDSANNGRFQPGTPIGADHPYQVVAMLVDVINANVGVTLNLGTTVAGTEIASAIDIGSTGAKYGTYVQVAAVAGGYLYATPSAGITNGDIKIEFVVITNYATCNAVYYYGNGDYTRISNSLLQSNNASDAFHIQSTTPVNWSASHCLIETIGATNNSIKAISAMSNVPIYLCRLIGSTTNITSFATESVKLDDLGAPDDNTDLNVSTTKHGLVPKGTNVGNYLKDDGTWALPAGSGDMTKAVYDPNEDGVIAAAQLDTTLLVDGDMTTHEGAADPHTGYRLESADHSHQSTGAQAGQLDHGLALTGLTDDDHTQYLLADGTRTLTGDNLLGENAGLKLDPALSADGKYCGITEGGTAGAALAFGDLVYLAVADSRWELCDASAAATAIGKIGICVLAAVGDGSATTVLLWGKVRADTAFPALTVGAPVFMSETAGDITMTAPTTSASITRIVGYGNTADELFFCPEKTFVEHV